jgi:hypothetical protein
LVFGLFSPKKNQSLFSLISYFLGLIVIVAFVKNRCFGFLCNYLKNNCLFRINKSSFQNTEKVLVSQPG